jgi:hypothetical protein
LAKRGRTLGLRKRQAQHCCGELASHRCCPKPPKQSILWIPKTHNPLIIKEKKAEIKLSFISLNQKKGEICDLVLRNQ